MRRINFCIQFVNNYRFKYLLKIGNLIRFCCVYKYIHFIKFCIQFVNKQSQRLWMREACEGLPPKAAGAKHGANSDPEARRRLMLGKYEPSA